MNHESQPLHSDGASESVRHASSKRRPPADMRGTLRHILADVETLIRCDRAIIWLLDADGQHLSVVVGREDGQDWDPEWTESVDWPPFAPAIRDGEFIMRPRTELPGLERIAPAGHRFGQHFLIGPIQDGGRPFGVFSLSRYEDRPFIEADLQTLQTVAGIASIAVQASLAIEREREHRHTVMQMGILTAALNQARTPDAVIEALLRGVMRQVGIEHAYVVRLGRAVTNTVEVHLAKPLRVDGRAVVRGLDPNDLAVEAELGRTRRCISGSRLRELLKIPPAEPPDGMHGLAAVPIRNGTRLDGVLYLWTPIPPGQAGFRDLSAAEIDVAESLCAQAAVALERTWLQELAQQAAHEQKVLAEFASRVSSTITSEEMAAAALAALDSMFPIATGCIALAGDMPDREALLATWPDDTSIDAVTCDALRMLAQWVQAGTVGWSGPLATWLPNGDPDRHVTCWPVASDDLTIGTLTILRDGTEPFAPHEVELVSQTCGQLALGLQRARAHIEAIIARDEAERNADLIAQILSVSNEMILQQELDDVLDVMDRGLADVIDYSVLEIYTADVEHDQLDLIHFHAIDDRQPAATRMPFGSGSVGRAARLRRPAQGSRVGTCGETRVLAMPMVIEGELLGVITLGRDRGESFSKQELSLLGIFSAHAASAISRAALTRRNRELYLGGIRALTSTVDAKDPHTRGHSARVGRMARLIAEQMGLPREEIERVELAGLLHDVGKVAIPDLILQKPGPLDQEERAIMMGHTEMGAHILGEAGSDVLDPLVPLVLHHHEWWDGRGYPHSLRGEDIPVGAQIIAVADAFDTMTHDRPYRKRSTLSEAWAELQRCSGTQFAPSVVAATSAAIELLPPSDEADTLAPDRIPRIVEPLAEPGGQLGDLRSLGILVGLARITSHITDLASLMEQTLALLSERLDMSLVLVVSPGGRRHASVTAYSQRREDYRVHPCPGSSCLDTLLGASLPTNLESIPGYDTLPLAAELVRTPSNAGVIALRSEEEVTGALVFEPHRPEHYWRSDLEVIAATAPHVAAAINVARIHEQVKEDALTDGLTGALNYRAFQRQLNSLIEREEPFAVLMFDVVGLKPLNDTVGHLAGDQLLRHSVNVISSAIGPGSVAGRIGGDEFGALLTGDDALKPQAIGQDIVTTMERDVAAAYRHTVTLRFGWATWPLDGRAPDLLLHVADQRMYLNHPSGRDPLA